MSTFFFFLFLRGQAGRQAGKLCSSPWGESSGTQAGKAPSSRPSGQGGPACRSSCPGWAPAGSDPARLGRLGAQWPLAAHTGAKPAFGAPLSTALPPTAPSWHRLGTLDLLRPGRRALLPGFAPRGAQTQKGASPLTRGLGLPRPAQQARPEGSRSGSQKTREKKKRGGGGKERGKGQRCRVIFHNK